MIQHEFEELLEQFSQDPLTSEGRVFIGCGDGKIYCLNSASGEIVWGYQTDGLMRQRPILENGILYAFVRDTYIWYAIDASTGQLIWRGNANTDESLFVCGDVRPVIANGKLWCIDTAYYIRHMNPFLPAPITQVSLNATRRALLPYSALLVLLKALAMIFNQNDPKRTSDYQKRKYGL